MMCAVRRPSEENVFARQPGVGHVNRVGCVLLSAERALVLGGPWVCRCDGACGGGGASAGGSVTGLGAGCGWAEWGGECLAEAAEEEAGAGVCG